VFLIVAYVYTHPFFLVIVTWCLSKSANEKGAQIGVLCGLFCGREPLGRGEGKEEVDGE
jgi:hypothetical protein